MSRLALDVPRICPVCGIEFHPRRDRLETQVCCVRGCTLVWLKQPDNRKIHATRMRDFLEANPDIRQQRGAALQKHSLLHGHPRLGIPRPDMAARMHMYDVQHLDQIVLHNQSMEQRASVRAANCRNWENPEYRKRVCKRRDMSAPEIRFASLVQEYNLPYRFVGNGDLWLGRRNPDFAHLSEHKLIEIWGDYYHKGQKPEDRAAYFEKFGYSTLVIWASELIKEDAVLAKVELFEGGT